MFALDSNNILKPSYTTTACYKNLYLSKYPEFLPKGVKILCVETRFLAFRLSGAKSHMGRLRQGSLVDLCSNQPKMSKFIKMLKIVQRTARRTRGFSNKCQQLRQAITGYLPVMAVATTDYDH